MLALIDYYFFDIKGTDITEIEHDLTFGFEKTSRLKNFDVYQKTGKYEEDISFSGDLICESQYQLTLFEEMAKTGDERTMVLGDGTCRTVLINHINKKKSNFLTDGKFLRQEYTVNISVVGDGFGWSVGEIIAGLVA